MITNRALLEELEGTQLSYKPPSGGTKEFNLKEVFEIDIDQLSNEFSKQASLYAYFAALTVRAEDALFRAENFKDKTYATAELYYREDAENNNRKITEAAVKSMVMTDAEYQDAVMAESSARYDLKAIKMIVTALEQRAEMLISLGAHVRAELDMTGMNIRSAKNDEIVNDVKKTIQRRREIVNKQV